MTAADDRFGDWADPQPTVPDDVFPPPRPGTTAVTDDDWDDPAALTRQPVPDTDDEDVNPWPKHAPAEPSRETPEDGLAEQVYRKRARRLRLPKRAGSVPRPAGDLDFGDVAIVALLPWLAWVIHGPAAMPLLFAVGLALLTLVVATVKRRRGLVAALFVAVVMVSTFAWTGRGEVVAVATVAAAAAAVTGRGMQSR